MRPGLIPFTVMTLLFLWNGLAFAVNFETHTVVFDPAMEGQFFGKNLYLTMFDQKDSQPEQAWQRIQSGHFFQVDQERPNFGLSRETLFGYFQVRNPESTIQTVILENNFGMADYFQLFRMDELGGFEEVFVGGDQVDITRRHVTARTMNTQLVLQPGINRFMVKTYSDTCLQLPLRLWREASYRDQMFKEYLALGFLVGVHLVMILYNIFLGVSLKDKVYFYYVIFVISNVVYHVSNYNLGQYLGWILFGTKVYSNHIQLLAVDSIIISSILFSKRFLNFYKPEYPVLNTIMSVNIGISIFNVLVNNWLSVWLASIFTCISASACLNMLVFIGFLKLRARYQPAIYFLLGWGAYLNGSWGIVAVNIGILEAADYNYWAQFVGGAIEVSLFSLALGSRINFIKKKNHEHIKSLNSELQTLNASLEKQVEERTMETREILKHLHQGIFTVRSNKVIEPEYSRFLETIFKQKDLDGKNIVSLLESQSNLSRDDLNRLSNAIDFSINEDETCFLMNKDCFPDSVVFQNTNGTQQFLEFDWVGIVNESITRKILISVRDTTEKRLLVQQISEKDEELSYISQLIEIKAERFNQFAKVSSELLDEVDSILSSASSQLDPTFRRNLLINYHTLKGLTRTLGLSDLSNALHHAETELSLPAAESVLASLSQIRANHEKIRTIFNQYKAINNDKLGRFIDPNFELVPKVLIHNLIRDIEEAGAMGPDVSRDVAQLKTFYYKFIDDIVFGHMNAIKSICDQLDKPMPKFKFQDSCYGLAPRAVEVIDLAVAQLIRNSLDHGIERPMIRLAQGKQERGLIEFRMSEYEDHLEIRIADDGQGLLLGKIKAVAVKRGNLEASCEDPLKIAHQIFEPSISTKTEVSTISGRGIGLDAAKTSLHQVGGQLTLCLLDAPDFDKGCRFEFVISLPKDQYCRVATESNDYSHFAA